MEDTLVLIKPDAFKRRMVGQVITSIENLGLDIKNMYYKTLTEDEAAELYGEHKGKWHFARNIKHITSGPSVVIHVFGKEAVSKCRQMIETFRNAHQDLIKLPANLAHATSNADRTSLELAAVGCIMVV